MSNFETIESKLCKLVLGLSEREAYYEILEQHCLPFVVRRDKKDFPYPNKCAHSYRVNLVISRGKVISAYLG